MKLALSLVEQDRYEEAEAEARRVYARSPDPMARAVLAWVLIAGDLGLEEGTALAEEAVSMPRDFFMENGLRVLPFLPSGEHALGLSHLKNKRYADAVPLLERAAELQPNRKLIEEHLAEAKRSL